jgi:hypothetical protein
MHDGFAFSGANAEKVTKISTVKEVFDELTDEYNKAELSNNKD